MERDHNRYNISAIPIHSARMADQYRSISGNLVGSIGEAIYPSAVFGRNRCSDVHRHYKRNESPRRHAAIESEQCQYRLEFLNYLEDCHTERNLCTRVVIEISRRHSGEL